MKSTQRIIGLAFLMLMMPIYRAFAQTDEIGNLFRDFEAKAATGSPCEVAEADPAFERLAHASSISMSKSLPEILHQTSNPNRCVRGLAALALYQVTTRRDGPALLSTETATFNALLLDADIPIRRISILVVHNLRLNADSPLIPVLETYLGREDAVSTIGAGVATNLMEAAPDRAESIGAIVQYMKRKDQTAESRDSMLTGVRYAKSKNREIGRQVAAYADDPNEELSIRAIEILEVMGKSTVQDNQNLLLRIAADTRRRASVRTAATKAIAAAQ